MSSSETMGSAIALLIDGDRVASASGSCIPVVNPSTGQSLYALAVGDDADVDRAVASARQAHEDGRWRNLPPSARKRILHRFADLVERDAADLDLLDAREMGKPLSVRFCSATSSAGLIRFCAEAIDKITGDVYSSDALSLVIQRKVPRGVVAAIVPWNFPVYVAVLKLAPALAAGNSVVLKPSEMAPLSALRLAELALEAGLPAGVLNVVPGLGSTVGQALARHDDIDMITFTGSTAVGKLIMQYAGQSNLKAVMAECGGKSPQIIFADGVDLDQAAQGVAQLLLTNQGQICSVGSRLLVQRSIHDLFLDKVSSHLAAIRAGDATDPDTTFGPVASERQYDRVMDYIALGRQEGAECVTGGKRLLEGSGGFYVAPTIFANVSPEARIAQEEIFGPVLSAIPFEDDSEAISIANATPYGLSAYVWSASLTTAMRLAKGIRSSVRVVSAAPLGEGAGFAATAEPAGASGIGAEGGVGGIESYLRRQRVAFHHG